MAIVYEDRPELMMTSKAVRELYFAAIELLETLDEAGMGVVKELVLQEPELEGVDRLRLAVQQYQGEELTPNGNNHQD